jgi:hypothetical protein
MQFIGSNPDFGAGGPECRPGGFCLFSPFPTALLGASELARLSDLVCMISHSVSHSNDLS